MNTEKTITYSDQSQIVTKEIQEPLVFTDIVGEETPQQVGEILPISDITRATIEQGRATKRVAPSTPFEQPVQ